jgi:uroporphyrinogen-III decarboxylase
MIYIFTGKDSYDKAIKFARSKFSVIRYDRNVDLTFSYEKLNNKVIVSDNIDTITRLVFYSEVIKEDNNVDGEVLTDYILKYLVEVR